MQKFKWQIITRIENRRIDELQASESIDDPQSEILNEKSKQVEVIESVDEALVKRNLTIGESFSDERHGSDTV